MLAQEWQEEMLAMEPGKSHHLDHHHLKNHPHLFQEVLEGLEDPEGQLSLGDRRDH